LGLPGSGGWGLTHQLNLVVYPMNRQKKIVRFISDHWFFYFVGSFIVAIVAGLLMGSFFPLYRYPIFLFCLAINVFILKLLDDIIKKDL
jgi:hypothetical protein